VFIEPAISLMQSEHSTTEPIGSCKPVPKTTIYAQTVMSLTDRMYNTSE